MEILFKLEFQRNTLSKSHRWRLLCVLWIHFRSDFSILDRAQIFSTCAFKLSATKMRLEPQCKIIDITGIDKHQKYLHRCLAGPFRQYKKRTEYLKKAIPKGFHKKLLIFKGNIVGQIEYSPAKVSYYPIVGDKIIVMNCIWVLKKARGHNFGKQLLDDMIRSEKNTTGFATIALEGHWSPWFKKSEMEQLGFKPLDSIEVVHKTKHKGQFFKIYLMWMPITKNAKPPAWNQQKLLEGITSCILHPLYRPQTYEQEQIFQRHQDAREKS